MYIIVYIYNTIDIYMYVYMIIMHISVYMIYIYTHIYDICIYVYSVIHIL